MEKEKPRLARLTSIITDLQSKPMITAREIADKHDISIRTVYRDMRTLEQSGIPICTESGKGYSIMEGYKLPPVMFTEEEANALITAEKLIRLNKDKSLRESYSNAITKIKSVLRFKQKEKSELLSERIRIKESASEILQSDHLIQLQSTITNYQLVELNYLSLENQESKRKVEPFALLSSSQKWLLIANCRLRNDFRIFRLDRIKSLKVLNSNFEPHKITLEEFLERRKK